MAEAAQSPQEAFSSSLLSPCGYGPCRPRKQHPIGRPPDGRPIGKAPNNGMVQTGLHTRLLRLLVAVRAASSSATPSLARRPAAHAGRSLQQIESSLGPGHARDSCSCAVNRSFAGSASRRNRSISSAASEHIFCTQLDQSRLYFLPCMSRSRVTMSISASKFSEQPLPRRTLRAGEAGVRRQNISTC